MSIFFRLSKKIFPAWFKRQTRDKLERYLAASRVAYFFLASTLFLFVTSKYKELEVQKQLEAGNPVIDAAKFKKGGMIKYEYRPGVGVVKTEYSERQLYNKMEQEALERAMQAQEKLLAQGKQLPAEAIRLVE